MESALYLSQPEISRDHFKEGQLGYAIKSIDDGLEDIQIAFVGVAEYRGAGIENPGREILNVLRKELYSLSFPFGNLKVMDAGDIVPGETLQDTFVAVTQVSKELLENNILTIVLGGSQDLTYGLYKAYEDIERIINLVAVDNQFDLGDVDDPIGHRSYLNKIILSQPNFLFNFSNLGYQSYFVKSDEKKLMEKLHFDFQRLGEVQADIQEVEPIVRNADTISFDLSCIRNSDANGAIDPSPNGFFGQEACAITRYSGLSDKLSSIGIYNLDPQAPDGGQTIKLVSQMVWYVLEGYNNRKNDSPVVNRKDFLRYTVASNSEYGELVFYKNLISERWWMDVPLPASKLSKYERHQLIPCSYRDYLKACQEEIPSKWIKSYEKLM